MPDVFGTWLQAIARNETDVGVVVPEPYLRGIECKLESDGQASTGWHCLWGEIPHLCVFASDEVCNSRWGTGRGCKCGTALLSHLPRVRGT